MTKTNLIKDKKENNTIFKENDISEGRMATVLQVLPNLGSDGGVERGAVEIAQAVVETGGRALVAAATGPKVHELNRAKAEHIDLPLHSKNPVVIYKNIARLAELIKREKVDIVHARSRAPAWSAYFAAKRTNCAFVTTFHGTYSYTGLLKRKYNSVMTLGDKVIAISNFIATHIRQNYGIPNEKVRIIHRGVDLKKFDPSVVSAERIINLAKDWRLTGGNPVVMLPGRLTRWKGQVNFIKAIAMLNRTDVRCLLVGGSQGRKDYRKELENLILKNSLEEVVRIVDHCNDMPAAYMLADLVVSASIEPEAFGRVIVEAQALGRPVVASDHGGARETMIEGKTGWLVKPGDILALSKAIDCALSLNEDARTEFFKNGIDNVKARFSKDTMCANTLAVYNEVLGAKEST